MKMATAPRIGAGRVWADRTRRNGHWIRERTGPAAVADRSHARKIVTLDRRHLAACRQFAAVGSQLCREGPSRVSAHALRPVQRGGLFDPNST